MTVDRRIRRTREALQQALIALIRERRYEDITVQEIAERANVGRTTFYLHFNNKDELFIDCHESIVRAFQIAPLFSVTREVLQSAETPPGIVRAFEHLEGARPHLDPIFQSKGGLLILRGMREWSAHAIEVSLKAGFAEPRAFPVSVLAAYLAGAQIALVQWWLEKRRPHTPENVAQRFHRAQRAAILDAFGLSDNDGENEALPTRAAEPAQEH